MPKPHDPAYGKPPKKTRAVPKRGAPKTTKNRNRTPPIMGFVRDIVIGSTAPNSPPDREAPGAPRNRRKPGGSKPPLLSSPAPPLGEANPLCFPALRAPLPVPASPLFPNKAHAGPHLDLRNHLGSARRPQIHAERLQNRFGRRVEKRARVIFEIMTWRRIISEHSNLRKSRAFTPKPHQSLEFRF